MTEAPYWSTYRYQTVDGILPPLLPHPDLKRAKEALHNIISHPFVTKVRDITVAAGKSYVDNLNPAKFMERELAWKIGFGIGMAESVALMVYTGPLWFVSGRLARGVANASLSIGGYYGFNRLGHTGLAGTCRSVGKGMSAGVAYGTPGAGLTEHFAEQLHWELPHIEWPEVQMPNIKLPWVQESRIFAAEHHSNPFEVSKDDPFIRQAAAADAGAHLDLVSSDHGMVEKVLADNPGIKDDVTPEILAKMKENALHALERVKNDTIEQSIDEVARHENNISYTPDFSPAEHVVSRSRELMVEAINRQTPDGELVGVRAVIYNAAQDTLGKEYVLQRTAAAVGAHLDVVEGVRDESIKSVLEQHPDLVPYVTEAVRHQAFDEFLHQAENLGNHDFQPSLDAVTADPTHLQEHLNASAQAFTTHLSDQATQESFKEAVKNTITTQALEAKAQAGADALINTPHLSDTLLSGDHLKPEMGIELNIDSGDTVSGILAEHGQGLEYSPADVDILAAHIYANYSLLDQMIKDGVASGEIPQGTTLPSLHELHTWAVNAKMGDELARRRLLKALHYIPQGKAFKLLSDLGIHTSMGELAKAA